MYKCKWAGDASDEYCKDCNGVDMVVEGKTISCDQCAGYEPSKEKVEVEGEDSNPVEGNMNPPEEDKKEEKKENKIVSKTADKKSEAKDSDKEQPKVSNNTSKDKNSENTQDTAADKPSNNIPEGVVPVSLRYMSGCTIQKGDTYYKFTAEEEWAVDPMVVKTPEQVDEVREKLWAKVNSEVDKQVDDVLNM